MTLEGDLGEERRGESGGASQAQSSQTLISEVLKRKMSNNRKLNTLKNNQNAINQVKRDKRLNKILPSIDTGLKKIKRLKKNQPAQSKEAQAHEKTESYNPTTDSRAGRTDKVTGLRSRLSGAATNALEQSLSKKNSASINMKGDETDHMSFNIDDQTGNIMQT